ncbi:lipoate-protein ligase B [mine drainage metagenome]|uniref:Lipoate-protein ligase B n=1 Tax=mine drainage metagenome TaxID=410659 RepID=T1CB16_9ZZZZ
MTTPIGSIQQECVEGYLFARPPMRVMILRRPPARGSIWVPISGKVDAADSDWEATIRRELREETGLETPKRLFALDWHVTFEGPQGGTWRLHAFGVEVDPGWAPRLSEEHDRYAWMTPEEAVARLHYADNRTAMGRLLERVGP